jgi:hypothetical protein
LDNSIHLPNQFRNPQALRQPSAVRSIPGESPNFSVTPLQPLWAPELFFPDWLDWAFSEILFDV